MPIRASLFFWIKRSDWLICIKLIEMKNKCNTNLIKKVAKKTKVIEKCSDIYNK